MKDELRTNNVHSFIPLGGPYAGEVANADTFTEREVLCSLD